MIMKLYVIVHRAKEGGYWAEVPALPGCFTQAETMEELRENIIDALTGMMELSENEIKKFKCYKIIEADLEINFREGVCPVSKKERLAGKTDKRKPFHNGKSGK
jgi:predicted RNase H-like HicB family nuclease